MHVRERIAGRARIVAFIAIVVPFFVFSVTDLWLLIWVPTALVSFIAAAVWHSRIRIELNQHRRAARTLLMVDVAMGAALVVDAIMVARWPLTAVMIMALGIIIAMAALVLEPATTKATLGEVEGGV